MKYVTTHGHTFALNVTDWQHSIDADAMEGLLEDIVLDLMPNQIEQFGKDCDASCNELMNLNNYDFIVDEICDAYNVITDDYLGLITEGHIAEIYYVGADK